MKILGLEEKSEELVTTLFDIPNVTSDKVTIGRATILPGERLPAEGTTFHQEDEYSYIMKGDIYTFSGNQEQIVKEGSTTFIPRGEDHWCRNDGTEPVEVLWVFIA